MIEILLFIGGVGVGFAGGLYLGRLEGTRFLKDQIDITKELALSQMGAVEKAIEKTAQVLVAPYGLNPVPQTPQQTQELFDDLTNDQERLPAWMEEDAEEEADAS